MSFGHSGGVVAPHAACARRPRLSGRFRRNCGTNPAATGRCHRTRTGDRSRCRLASSGNVAAAASKRHFSFRRPLAGIFEICELTALGQHGCPIFGGYADRSACVGEKVSARDDRDVETRSEAGRRQGDPGPRRLNSGRCEPAGCGRFLHRGPSRDPMRHNARSRLDRGSGTKHARQRAWTFGRVWSSFRG